MKTPPSDLDHDQIVTAIATGWGHHVQALDYAPLGFGSHHWIAEVTSGEHIFITVDDLRAEHLSPDVDTSFRMLESAFGIAARLRDRAGLSFVVAPLPTRTGRVVHRLASHYSMALFPRLDVVPSDFGEFANEDDRKGALRLIGQVHAATKHIPVQDIRQDTLVIPGRDRFEATLDDTVTCRDVGPYGEPARKLLRAHASDILVALERFDALVREVTTDTSGWVITHGEPHAGNIVRTTGGEQLIVDWDTVAFAPPERDLRMLVDEQHPDWSGYREVTGLAGLSDAALEACRLHWDLSEVAIFTAWCRAPHEDTEEMRIAWRELRNYLAGMG